MPQTRKGPHIPFPAGSSSVKVVRWLGWIGICDEHGIVRSMARKGCSPDNQRFEGFFGRCIIEFYYRRDWRGVSIEEFMEMLDGHLVLHRDKRRKSDLGYMNPK